MPAEWAPHHGTLLSWPRNAATWPGHKLARVELVFVEIVKALTPHEQVYICCGGIEPHVHALLEQHKTLHNVTLLPFATNDNWMRDHGPIFVLHKQTGHAAITGWEYNAWGGKYPPYDDDNRIPGHIAVHFGLPMVEPGIVMEGGSLEVDGLGTLLTTRACLLNKNRNPQLNQQQIEEYLCRYLGVERVLWLEDGIVGDDTDGHIDDLTRLVSADTLVTIVESNPDDENYAILQHNLKDLQQMRSMLGQPYRIIQLPMPPALVEDGERLPASYANYYVANNVVLLPTFGHPTDQVAADRLAECFPGREIVQIPSAHLLWGLGGIHCVTQQIPAAPNLQ